MHSERGALLVGHIFGSGDPTIPFLYDESQKMWDLQKNYSLGIESPLILPRGLQLGQEAAR